MKNRRSFLKTSAVLGTAIPTALSFSSAGKAESAAEVTDHELTATLDRLVGAFRGDVGIYVRHIPSSRTVRIRADELFPTASMIKVSIMMSLFDLIDQGKLAYHQKLVYDGKFKYPYMNEDILDSYRIGETIKLSKLIMLMITISDNSASYWAQHLAGTGTQINDVLAAHGFENLRINSRTPGREDAYKEYGWGQTTPYEMCRLFELIRFGKAVSPAASEEMYRILTRVYWSGEALSQIPPWVQTASKQGALSRSRSETVLVNAPHGDYVFCAVTRNQEDTGWDDDNEGYQLMRYVSRACWRHFEPDYGWEPATKVGEWNR